MPRSYVFPEMQDAHDICIREADEKSESIFYFSLINFLYNSLFCCVSNQEVIIYFLSEFKRLKWY